VNRGGFVVLRVAKESGAASGVRPQEEVDSLLRALLPYGFGDIPSQDGHYPTSDHGSAIRMVRNRDHFVEAKLYVLANLPDATDVFGRSAVPVTVDGIGLLLRERERDRDTNKKH
jgi:hypothetical protein